MAERQVYYPPVRQYHVYASPVKEEDEDDYEEDVVVESLHARDWQTGEVEVPTVVGDDGGGGDGGRRTEAEEDIVVVDDDEYSDDDDFDQTVLNAIQRDKETKEREAEERERKRIAAHLEAQEAQAHAIGALTPIAGEGAAESNVVTNAQSSPRYRPSSGRGARPSSASRMRPKSASRQRPVRPSIHTSCRPSAAGSKHGRPESARRSRPDAVPRIHDGQNDLPMARLGTMVSGQSRAPLRTEMRNEFRPASGARCQNDTKSASGENIPFYGAGDRGYCHGRPTLPNRHPRAFQHDGTEGAAGEKAAASLSCEDLHLGNCGVSADIRDEDGGSRPTDTAPLLEAFDLSRDGVHWQSIATGDKGPSHIKKGKSKRRRRPGRGKNVESSDHLLSAPPRAHTNQPSNTKQINGVARRTQLRLIRPTDKNHGTRKLSKMTRKDLMQASTKKRMDAIKVEKRATKATRVFARVRDVAVIRNRQIAARKRRALVCHNMQGKTSRASRRQQREREERASIRRYKGTDRSYSNERRPHTAPMQRDAARQVLRIELRRRRQKLRNQIRRERELAWNCSNPVSSRGIPEYDPRSDQHCRWLSTPGVQKLIATSYANALNTDSLPPTNIALRRGASRHRLHYKFQAHVDAQDMLQLAVERSLPHGREKPLNNVEHGKLPSSTVGEAAKCSKSVQGSYALGSPPNRCRGSSEFVQRHGGTESVAIETGNQEVQQSTFDVGGATNSLDWAKSRFFEEAQRQVEAMKPHNDSPNRTGNPASIEIEEQQFNNLYLAVHNPNQLHGAFLSAKNQLEALWEELDFPQAERIRLSTAYFNSRSCSVNPAHYASVLAEITRLLQYRTLVLQLLRCICQRENLVGKLKKILCDNDSATMAKLNLRYSRKAVAAAMNQMAAVRELDKDISAMVKWWRCALEWNDSFMFNGEDYLVKIKRDDIRFMEMGGCC